MTPLASAIGTATEQVQALQAALCLAAKSAPERRFYSLYDKVYRDDVLLVAWEKVRQNRGAAGMDGQTIGGIEAAGVEGFLRAIQQELREHRYWVPPVRRVFIPKADGKQRPLGIPTVRDRVVQQAVRLVLEPIFEAGFSDCSYGYRPNRSARDATLAIRKWLNFGLERVLDADIASFFDSIPHEPLMRRVERRIADGRILHLLRRWLRAGVLQQGQVRPTEEGTPQGGVISPLLANIYLDQLDKAFVGWGTTEYGPQAAVLVRYADDFVLLSRAPVWGLRRKVHRQLQEMGLELKLEKTRVVKAEEGFDFLGFRFVKVPAKQRRKGRVILFFPTPRSVQRAREKVRERLGRPQLSEPVEEVVRGVNRFLRGWSAYFRHSNASRAFKSVQWHVNERLRRFLQRRRQKRGQGFHRWTDAYLYGVLKLENIATGRTVRVWR